MDWIDLKACACQYAGKLLRGTRWNVIVGDDVDDIAVKVGIWRKVGKVIETHVWAFDPRRFDNKRRIRYAIRSTLHKRGLV